MTQLDETILEGFTKLTETVRKSVGKSIRDPFDLGVYAHLKMEANWSTGIYHGTALGIAYKFGNLKLHPKVKRSLFRLRKARLVNYWVAAGSRGSYDVLIDGFEVTLGGWKGQYLNAWQHGSNAQPEYGARLDAGLQAAGERLEDGCSTAGSRLEDGHTQDVSTHDQDGTDISGCSQMSPAKQSKAEQLGVAQLDPHSGQNGKNKDSNPHHAVHHSDDDDEFDPEALEQFKDVWDRSSSIDEMGPRPFDERDFIRLVNKWHVKIDETKYHLFDMIIFAWRVSPFFTYIKDSRQFEEDFIDVLQKFNGYRSKCSPTKFRKILTEAWERLTDPDTQDCLAFYLKGDLTSPATTTPDCALAPTAHANVFDEMSEHDDEEF